MNNQTTSRQKGAVLIVGLVLLVALTLIGVAAIKMTSLDQRIAANAQYRTMVFQAAESMLSEAASFESVQKCIAENFKEGCVPAREFSVGNGQVVQATARISRVGDIESGGNSIGQGGGGVARLGAFLIEAESRLNNTHAIAVHRLQVGITTPVAQ